VRGPHGFTQAARPDAAGAPGNGRVKRVVAVRARRGRAAATVPARLGVFAVAAAALLGLVITVLSGSEPGVILGILVVTGTIVGVLAVRPGATYFIFPVPAPAYAVAALIAGLIRDHANDSSATALALNAGQWIATGFIPMTAATALAVLIAGYRWLRNV
jgi:hypothetical protein